MWFLGWYMGTVPFPSIKLWLAKSEKEKRVGLK
jgi:hypothetical protein